MGFLLLLPSLSIQKNSDEDDGPVYLEEDLLTLQTGTTLNIQCYTDFNLTATNQRLAWFDPNVTDINTLNDTRRRYTLDGELVIDPLRVDDSGDYLCALVPKTTADTFGDDAEDSYTISTDPNSHFSEYNTTLTLKVYVMPDYYVAGMVILCINGSLCVLFFACLLHSHIKQEAYLKKLEEETVPENPAITELKVKAWLLWRKVREHMKGWVECSLRHLVSRRTLEVRKTSYLI